MLPSSSLHQYLRHITGGRKLNRGYMLALVLPLLLIALFAALRAPFCRDIKEEASRMFGDGYETDDFENPPTSPEIKVADLKGSPEEKGWQIVNRRGELFEAASPDYTQTDPNANLYGADENRLKRIKELLGSDPNNITLLTMYLKMLDGYDGRVAGPWESNWVEPSASNNPYKFEPLSPYPYEDVRTATLTEGLIGDGLDIAKQGRKLEPQNIFFDWMTAFLLFARRSDKEAIRTLITASRKSEFSLHWRETLNAAFRNPGLASPPTAEEQLDLVEFASGDYNRGIIQHTARQALWFAMQEQERGNAKRALEIEGALVRLGYVMRTAAFFNDDRVQGALLMQEAWTALETITSAKNFFRAAKVPQANSSNNSNSTSTPIPNAPAPNAQAPSAPAPGPPRPGVPERAITLQSRQEQFKKYCLSMGRVDLARETEQFSKLETADLGMNGSYIGGLVKYQLTDFVRPQASLAMNDSGETLDSLIQQLTLTLGLWLFFVVLGPWRMPKGEVAPILAADFRWPIGASLLLLFLAAGVGFLDRMGNATALSVFLFSHSHSGELHDLARNSVVLMPVLCCAICCIFATRRHLKALPDPEPTRLSAPSVLGASLEVEMLHRLFWRSVCLFWFRILPVVLVLAWACLSMTFIDWGFIGGAHNHWTYPTPWFQIFGRDLRVTCVLALLPIAFTLFIRWRYAMPKHQRATIYGGFLGFRRLLAWCIPLNFWLTLACLVIGAGARAQVEADLQHFLDVERSVATEAQRLWPNSTIEGLE